MDHIQTELDLSVHLRVVYNKYDNSEEIFFQSMDVGRISVPAYMKL